MIFRQTRGCDGSKKQNSTFSEVLLSPSASFGGLYSPQSLPTIDAQFLNESKDFSYKKLAKTIIQKLGADINEDTLDSALATYDEFDDADVAPVKKVKDSLFCCELWHGPTRAFKDMALQPFGVIFSSLAKQNGKRYLVMTATSGDTGPAALSCLHNKSSVKVACLYPDGGTSDVQRMQMLNLNKDNLKVIAVNGAFDDAQNALKAMLADKEFLSKASESGYEISAANSVNFGRILFQIIYHFYAYLKLLQNKEIGLGEQIDVIVPSGNFGNALGGYYAKKMGLPIDKIIIASNSNDVLAEFIKTGEYNLTKRKLQKTIAPAMDILISSNIERILYDKFGADRTKELMQELAQNKTYKLKDYELKAIRVDFDSYGGNDNDASAAIKEYLGYGYLMDTHTALGFCAYKPIGKKTVVYSTAEWTKFAPDIAKALGANQMSDKDAIEFITQKANVKAPSGIIKLLDATLQTVPAANLNELEKDILAFLKD